MELAVIALGATPLLALAPVATYLLAVRWRLVPLPGDPASGAGGLLFAAGLLALPLGAQVARIGRAALLELGRAQFLAVARAKGAGPLRVWILHALPVASAPVVAVVATQLGALLGGAVVLERLFERPGLGTLILEAYGSRDLPVLEAAVVASGGLFVVTQTAAAVVHAAIDPRVRSS
ncbi:MAG: ABC transporter permease subunit [Polyangiaceae bacterium]|nr:ABC transporter permease subunit [Polyangiaceae bacterium]